MRKSENHLHLILVVFFQGKSLDWCMERREMAGQGQDINDVEKMLKKKAREEARKSELRARKEKERDNRQGNYVSIL